MGALGALAVALAMAVPADTGDLTRLTIDELVDLQVATVSRRPEARIDAPGAIHVITEEDIRRSGSTALPDALRLRFRMTAEGSVAFDIDLQRAEQTGLRLRSQLVKLARIGATDR